jgi:hypothetical protein
MWTCRGISKSFLVVAPCRPFPSPVAAMVGSAPLGLSRELHTRPIRNRPRTSRWGQVEHKPVATSSTYVEPPQRAHSPRATPCRNKGGPYRDPPTVGWRECLGGSSPGNRLVSFHSDSGGNRKYGRADGGNLDFHAHPRNHAQGRWLQADAEAVGWDPVSAHEVVKRICQDVTLRCERIIATYASINVPNGDSDN